MIDQLEKWIWLDGAVYPEYQLADYSGHFETRTHRYAVAEFSRRYAFEKKIVSAALRFSGDTKFQLFLNGECIATGPVSVGGDFLFNDFPRPTHYASRLTLAPDCSALDFFARVKLGPVGINEYSQGHGGFMLTCKLVFEDGTRDVLCTDETWLARRSGAFCEPWRYDGTIRAGRVAARRRHAQPLAQRHRAHPPAHGNAARPRRRRRSRRSRRRNGGGGFPL